MAEYILQYSKPDNDEEFFFDIISNDTFQKLLLEDNEIKNKFIFEELEPYIPENVTKNTILRYFNIVDIYIKFREKPIKYFRKYIDAMVRECIVNKEYLNFIDIHMRKNHDIINILRFNVDLYREIICECVIQLQLTELMSYEFSKKLGFDGSIDEYLLKLIIN